MIPYIILIGIVIGYVLAAAVIKVMRHRALNKQRVELDLPTKPLQLRRVRL